MRLLFHHFVLGNNARLNTIGDPTEGMHFLFRFHFPLCFLTFFFFFPCSLFPLSITDLNLLGRLTDEIALLRVTVSELTNSLKVFTSSYDTFVVYLLSSTRSPFLHLAFSFQKTESQLAELRATTECLSSEPTSTPSTPSTPSSPTTPSTSPTKDPSPILLTAKQWEPLPPSAQLWQSPPRFRTRFLRKGYACWVADDLSYGWKNKYYTYTFSHSLHYRTLYTIARALTLFPTLCLTVLCRGADGTFCAFSENGNAHDQHDRIHRQTVAEN